MLICYVDESGDTGALVPSERNTQPVFLISAVIVKQSSLNLKTAVGDEVFFTQSRREAENAEGNANLKRYRSCQN